MISTPSTCHHTETSLRNATRRTLKMFISACSAEDHGVDVDDLVRGAVKRARPEQLKQRVGEDRRAVVDPGGDRDLADQVEPAGEPTPHRAAHLGRPVVQTPGGRVLRRDLGHPEPDDDHEYRDHRPAVGLHDRAAVVQAGSVERQRP